MNILDLVIGLAFVYFLLSLICVSLQEIKSRIREERSKNLKKWVFDTFSKDGEKNDKERKPLLSFSKKDDKKNSDELVQRGLAGRLWNNIIIDGLTQEGKSASYVPKDLFVSALLDEIHYKSDDKEERKAYHQLEKLEAEKKKELGDYSEKKLQEEFEQHALQVTQDDAWKKKKDELGNRIAKVELLNSQITELSKLLRNGPEPYDFQSIRESIDTSDLIPTRIRRVLLQIHNESHHNIDSFRDRLERWFEHAMERNTGTFKKQAQAAVLFFSIVVTLGMNVNSLTLIQYFYDHPAEASRIADAAERTINDPATVKQLRSTAGDSVEIKLKEVRSSIDQLQSMKLPMGWEEGIKITGVGSVVNLFLGWLITIFAVSLGAPFWYDILNKLVSLRSTGKKPSETSTAEPGKNSPETTLG